MELSENKGIPPKFPNYNFKRENDKLQYQWILETATLFSIKTIFLNSSDLVNTQRFGSVGSLVSPVATRLSQARVILLPGIANRPGCIVHTSLTMTGVANC